MSAAPEAVARPPFWRDVRVLRAAVQILFLLVIAGVGAWLAGNLGANLRRQGITTSFDYLREPAGFTIADSDFKSSDRIGRAVVVGVRNTALVSIAGIALATIIGILVGIARLSRNWLVNRAAAVFVESIRNVPVLIIIIFFYQAVVLRLPAITDPGRWSDLFVFSNSGIGMPSLAGRGGVGSFWLVVTLGVAAAIGVGIWRTRRNVVTGIPHHRVAWGSGLILAAVVIGYLTTGRPLTLSRPEAAGFGITGGLRLNPEFAALLIALAVYTASHIAEIVRGSILAVPKGQSEAATALGLTEFQRMRYVVLPQAFRILIPPLANQYLNLTKNSSLAVAIGYAELTKITQIVIGNGNPAPQSIVIMMAIYLSFSLVISAITNMVNRRLQIATR